MRYQNHEQSFNSHPAAGCGHRLARASLLLCATAMLASGAAAGECASDELTNSSMAATTPTADFVLHDNGTATHKPTGLMWQRCTTGRVWNGQTERCEPGIDLDLDWFAAHRYVATLNDEGGVAGYTDWRLPNLNEFESIAELRCWNPAINTEVFPDIHFGGNERYWTASPFSHDPLGTSSAWTAQFSNGGLVSISLWSRNRLLLVRDAEADSPGP